MHEQWRKIPSFPGYFASSFGRIKGSRGWVMRATAGRGGYLHLGVSRAGEKICVQVSRCVCEAFHGLSPGAGYEAAHWDNDRQNNRSDNLRWATRKENREDMKRHGTHQVLELHPRAQLTNEEVRKIKCLYAAAQSKAQVRVKRGVRQRLADQFGVKISLIKDIVAGRSWQSIDRI